MTTCRPHNFELVKSYGADAVFDYSDADDCAAKIREYTEDGLKYAFDCISEGSSIAVCANAISSKGGHYSALLSVSDFPRDDVTSKSTLAYTAMGKAIRLRGNDIPAIPENEQFASKFWTLTEKLLKDGKFKTQPVKVGSGGLQGVFDGLDLLRKGKVSGEKLVYLVKDTP